MKTGDCIHSLPPAWCAVCAGTQPKPASPDAREPQGGRYLGPVREGWKSLLPRPPRPMPTVWAVGRVGHHARNARQQERRTAEAAPPQTARPPVDRPLTSQSGQALHRVPVVCPDGKTRLRVMAPPAEGFGAELQAARIAAGLTRPELGAVLDYSPDTIAKWEQGRIEPRGKAVKAVREWMAGQAGRTAAEDGGCAA